MKINYSKIKVIIFNFITIIITIIIIFLFFIIIKKLKYNVFNNLYKSFGINLWFLFLLKNIKLVLQFL